MCTLVLHLLLNTLKPVEDDSSGATLDIVDGGGCERECDTSWDSGLVEEVENLSHYCEIESPRTTNLDLVASASANQSDARKPRAAD